MKKRRQSVLSNPLVLRMTMATIAVFFLLSTGWATAINTSILGQNGWYSDDTRPDDPIPFPLNSNLVGATYTALPEGAFGTAAMDAEILEQVFFGPALGTVPFGTHLGAVRLYINPTNTGKTQISHRKDDMTGHASGAVLDDPGFFVTYSWMGTGAVPANYAPHTAGFKIGFKTSEFGSTPVSPKTGENAWDKLLVYEPIYNAHSANGTWYTENITRTSGNWWIVDRTAGAIGGTYATLAFFETSGIVLGSHTYADLYDLMTSGIITTVQFGIGSGVADADIYVNQLSTSFYRTGDVTTFGSLPVHNLTQLTDYTSIQVAINAANSGDVIQCDAGTFSENLIISKDLTLQGAGVGATIINASASPGRGIESEPPDFAPGWNIILQDFTLIGPSTGGNGYGIKLAGDIATAVITNVEVYGSAKSGVDLNGLASGTITNLYSHNNANRGLQMTDCDNITINGLTTAGNPWGGVVVATHGVHFTGGSSGITFMGALSMSESTPIYLERNAPGYPALTPPTVPTSPFTYLVGTTANIYNQGYYANASAALAWGPGAWARNRVTSHLTVLAGMNIQPAVDVATVSGQIIDVAAGTFVGQVKISGLTNLNMIGAGSGSTTIKAPAATLPYFFDTDPGPGVSANYAVLFCDGSTVNISDLTVDGDGKGNFQPNRFIGIGYWNSGGTVTNCSVTRVRHTPLNGAQSGLGIYANGSLPGPYAVSITGCTVDDCQKGGIVLNGASTVGTVSSTTVTLAGPMGAGLPAQNGIQFGFGSSGSISNSTANGCVYTVSGTVACGYIIYQAGTVNMTNCGGSNNQVGMFYIDASGNISGGALSSTTSATYYNAGFAAVNEDAMLGGNHRASPMVDPIANRGGQLDDPADDTVSVAGMTITGTLPVVSGSYGIDLSSSLYNLVATAQNNSVTNWAKGVSLETFGAGTISSGTVTGNTLNNTINGYDNVAGHTWNNNCYSDHGPAHPGFPAYNVDGGPNVDLNPNPTCSTADFVMLFDDPYVGCAPACADAVLKVVYTDANFRGGHLVITLPTGIVANLPTSPNYDGKTLIPGGQISTNLMSSFVNGHNTSTVTLDVFWSGTGSTGAPNQYIAWIPVRNTGAGNGTYAVSVASYDYWDVNDVHFSTGFDFVLPSIYVDCTLPTTTFGGGAGEASCDAYNSATDFANQLTYTITNAGTPASALVSAQIVLNGSFTYSVSTAGGTFPPAAVWADMVEGCNTFVLTATDAACNTSAPTSVTVEKDTQGPVVTGGTYTITTCHNNISGDPQYGASLLDANLNIDIADNDLCAPAGGTFDFSLSVTVANTQTVLAYNDVLSVTGYPNLTEAQTLWNAIVAAINNVNYSGPVTVNWTATDCAGNVTTGSFTINCVDFLEPANSFTLFDARPTNDGVWLKWTWTTTDAVEAQIFRIGEGDYPVYASSLWNEDSNYVKLFTTASGGWTHVATITGGQSSTAFTGAPNIHGGPGLAYWKDATVGPRDIYRYITFVKDAGGNWSQVASYTIGTNADRSTNYWLGDYEPALSAGVVNTADLSVLSSNYFRATVAGGGSALNLVDIGPANNENGPGKGIPSPTPTHFIDFYDLVPFSFNFGVVSVGGFNLETPRANPARTIDSDPVVVSVARANNDPLAMGDAFQVVVSLAGNEGSSLKDVEAMLTYDPQVLELVDYSSNAGEVYDGIAWSVAKPDLSRDGRLVIAAAAMGEIASFTGDFALATVTFRWVGASANPTSVAIESYHLADVFGNTNDGEGEPLGILGSGAIPTAYALYQNFPNPFNPSTTIRFDLPEAANVRLVIYNSLGQEIRALVSSAMPAGSHRVIWDGLTNSGDASGSGLYFYRLSANHFAATQKMLLTR